MAVATTDNKNPLPLPPGRTLVFVHEKKDAAGFFVCSICKKEFHTSDPAEGLHLFNSHKCAPRKKTRKA